MPDYESLIRITLMSGPRDGDMIKLPAPKPGQEATYSIGRSEKSDIALTFDSQVSRLHARLVVSSDDDTMHSTDDGPGLGLIFNLDDADSRNGTFVNEQRPRRVEGRVSILPGDLFRVGRTWLRIEP